MNIRQATTADAETLAEIGATTFYDTFHSFHTAEDMEAYIAKAYSVPAIIQNLSSPRICYFIAEEDGKAVGYTKILLDAQHAKLPNVRNAELEKIYVRKEYLDRKVGRDLMVHAIEFCRQQGFEHLFLGVWQENHRAVRFYERFGFSVIDTRTFTLGSHVCDDFILKLPIG